jgi:hypothetical protein
LLNYLIARGGCEAQGRLIPFDITVPRPVSANAPLQGIQVRRHTARYCLKIILQKDFVP